MLLSRVPSASGIRRWAAALVLVLAGCGPDIEGVHAGECRNGIDEDRDGRMDCADVDCAKSPDCVEPDGAPSDGVEESSPVADWDVPELGGDTGSDAGIRLSKTPSWRTVAAGAEPTCALRIDGTMACFGRPPTALPESVTNH